MRGALASSSRAVAGVELVSATTVRLLYGTLTARVPMQARGFTVLAPSGKIVDLGTEFGLSVADGGSTSVKVFTGLVEVFPLASSGSGETRGDGRARPHRPDRRPHCRASTRAVSEKDTVSYVRAILPPPVRVARTVNLDFASPARGTVLDVLGRGTGLTHRLPGTGSALPQRTTRTFV